jgi:hypothetical protein
MNPELSELIRNEYRGLNTGKFSQSFFVPHIDWNVSLDQFKFMVEVTYGLGTVNRIEFVPKTNQTDGHKYYQAFVYMAQWGNSYDAQNLRNQLVRGEQVKMFFADPVTGKQRYWQFCPNRSELAWLPHPEHTDLAFTVQAENVDLPMLYEIIEVDFELGKVESMEVTHRRVVVSASAAEDSTTTEETYETHIDVVIHFAYWFHTESAYVFQEMLRRYWYADLTFDDTITVSFFVREPIIEGVNPFIVYPEGGYRQRCPVDLDLDLDLESNLGGAAQDTLYNESMYMYSAAIARKAGYSQEAV